MKSELVRGVVEQCWVGRGQCRSPLPPALPRRGSRRAGRWVTAARGRTPRTRASPPTLPRVPPCALDYPAARTTLTHPRSTDCLLSRGLVMIGSLQVHGYGPRQYEPPYRPCPDTSDLYLSPGSRLSRYTRGVYGGCPVWCLRRDGCPWIGACSCLSLSPCLPALAASAGQWGPGSRG